MELIDYDVLTSTPDEREAIDTVNTILQEVEGYKSQAGSLVGSFESWYGALREKQSHWTVPGVIKPYRVSQVDVNEAQRRLYAIKQAVGAVTPEDEAPPAEIPPEQQPKDPIEEAENAAKTGITLIGVGLAAWLAYKFFS